jgi:hypothetical protein
MPISSKRNTVSGIVSTDLLVKRQHKKTSKLNVT